MNVVFVGGVGGMFDERLQDATLPDVVGEFVEPGFGELGALVGGVFVKALRCEGALRDPIRAWQPQARVGSSRQARSRRLTRSPPTNLTKQEPLRELAPTLAFPSVFDPPRPTKIHGPAGAPHLT
jgi:hypothetical protein